jgi:glycosyltransferase involved in cell wall biosynthesis
MRILHATKRFPDSSGGDGAVVSNLRTYQTRAGHDVHVLTSNCPQILDAHQVRKFGLRIESAQIDQINLRRILTLAWLTVSAFWMLRRVKPDIIHSHTMDFGYALSFAARLYRIPSVHTAHGISFGNPQFPMAKQKLEVFLVKHAGHRQLMTVDAPSLAAFADVGLPDVLFLPNAVEPSAFRQHRAEPAGRFRMLFAGRLEPVKGIPVLLEAMAMLAERHPEVELQLAGVGSREQEYRAIAARLGLAGQVTFLGRTPRAEMADRFAESDLFVLPSLHEGFPIVLLEAWAAGLPAVLTNVGAVPDVCVDGQDALVVEPGDAAGLAKALERAVGDGDLRGRLGANGRAKVESTYNYGSTTQALEAIYARALA